VISGLPPTEQRVGMPSTRQIAGNPGVAGTCAWLIAGNLARVRCDLKRELRREVDITVRKR
jgi:hypothetical protein